MHRVWLLTSEGCDDALRDLVFAALGVDPHDRFAPLGQRVVDCGDAFEEVPVLEGGLGRAPARTDAFEPRDRGQNEQQRVVRNRKFGFGLDKPPLSPLSGGNMKDGAHKKPFMRLP